eukprot:CAMPEP_0171467770 /NCGR_PEP_ID=MMETSP0945-20130129/10191_1 /TAXON_ID=109269 /ORGANISM="Vaucheria litorea, Strain CCMP2940" /LENGTH=269 /DNA_ID=CAMNT_0011996395 /DNA_START=355 /DNA_END=1162 /DNA_ORIENTATION=+
MKVFARLEKIAVEKDNAVNIKLSPPKGPLVHKIKTALMAETTLNESREKHTEAFLSKKNVPTNESKPKVANLKHHERKSLSRSDGVTQHSKLSPLPIRHRIEKFDNDVPLNRDASANYHQPFHNNQPTSPTYSPASPIYTPTSPVYLPSSGFIPSEMNHLNRSGLTAPDPISNAQDGNWQGHKRGRRSPAQEERREIKRGRRFDEKDMGYQGRGSFQRNQAPYDVNRSEEGEEDNMAVDRKEGGMVRILATDGTIEQKDKCFLEKFDLE